MPSRNGDGCVMEDSCSLKIDSYDIAQRPITDASRLQRPHPMPRTASNPIPIRVSANPAEDDQLPVDLSSEELLLHEKRDKSAAIGRHNSLRFLPNSTPVYVIAYDLPVGKPCRQANMTESGTLHSR